MPREFNITWGDDEQPSSSLQDKLLRGLSSKQKSNIVKGSLGDLLDALKLAKLTTDMAQAVNEEDYDAMSLLLVDLAVRASTMLADRAQVAQLAYSQVDKDYELKRSIRLAGEVKDLLDKFIIVNMPDDLLVKALGKEFPGLAADDLRRAVAEAKGVDLPEEMPKTKSQGLKGTPEDDDA